MQYRKIQRCLSALLLALFLLSAAPRDAGAAVPVKVSTSAAKVYRKASAKSKSRKVPKNTKLSVTAIRGGWARVSYKGKSAYMPVKDLVPTQRKKAYAGSAANVYNASGKRIARLPKGAGVYVLGTIRKRCCVLGPSGKIGFVASGALTGKKPDVSDVRTKPLSRVDKALNVARRMLGRRYSMSGSPPGSFNCSSFVRYCMGKAGYPMNGTALTQSMDGRYAKVRSLSKLRRGDVLFFDTTGDGKVDHSAIYISGGKFIEASRNAGCVQINTLTSWYRSHFKWARRPG